MARSAPALSTFTAGEISPRLEGRINIEKYREGLSDLTNMIVQPHGGVTRRPGTQFLGEVKNSAAKTRLIPFEFKTADTYALEFGNQYMRVLRNGLQVLEASAKTVTAITKANPGVLTSNGHGLSNGDEVFLTNTGAMTELTSRNYLIANVTTNTFTLTDLFGTAINTTNFTTFDTGVTVDKIYEITTPYQTADLFNLRFAQSADIMYIVHPSYQARSLARTDHNSWVLDALFLGEPQSPKNISAITQANPGVITSSSHGFSNGDPVLIEAIVGMTELNNKYFVVANATTNTFTLKDVDDNAINTTSFTAYSSGGTLKKIEASVPALYGAANHPSVVTFFEQRLVFGATSNNPQTLFFSKSADHENFTVGSGSAADDALIYTIASNKVNAIRYLAATRILVIGTSGGEFVLSTTNGGPVTSDTTVIRKYSNYGCTNDEPVQVADLTLFIQRGGRKVREFRYAGEIDTAGYAAPDITILAEHLTEGGLTAFAYQQEPESIVWALRDDGTLLGLTYRREEEVVAWHKHVIGGAFGSGQAEVESIISLPTDSGEDELYMIVKRTINSQTKRYIEVLKTFDFGSLPTTAFFVDSGLSYSGSSTSSLTGLQHLEGQSVAVLANGASHADKTVASSGISFDINVTSASVGFSYTSQMQTLRLEAGSVDGTSQGKPKRIHAVTLRLDETVGIEVGPDENNLDRIFFRDSSMSMDTAVPLFTGDKEIEFPGGYDDDAKIFVRQTQPLPMTVLAIYPRLNTFDK
tara:strand:+ start:2919 stop:5183 length:2265 start_codon:yes stop_codon:yes gene_type:complete